jgi:hypothetical protein
MSDQITVDSWRDLARERKLDFMFQRFRPHGSGLAELFRGVVGFAEILPRLFEVYEVTSSGYLSDSGEDAYFIVRQPLCSRADQICELACRHLAEMSHLVPNDRQEELFQPFPRVEIVDGSPRPSPDLD